MHQPPPSVAKPATAAKSVRLAISALIALLLVAPSGGCRICADCDVHAYPSYGGKWQRTRREAGRVGSVFNPAGARLPELDDRDAPPGPDELERRRAAERGGSQPPRPEDGYELDDDLRTPEQIEAERRRRQQELERLELRDINGDQAQQPAPPET